MNDTIQVRVHATGPDSCRITVAGDLDVVGAPDLRETVQAAVAGHRHVLVDCGGVTFCDCSGLNALLGAARVAKSYGTDLRLCAVPRPLARLLRLSHTGSAFTIEHGHEHDHGGSGASPVPGKASAGTIGQPQIP